MKRKFARIAAIVLALVLVLAACGEEKTSINVEKTLTHQLSEEEVTFTLFAKKLDDYYGQDVFTEAFKMTNVMLEPVLSENESNTSQALALSIASGDMADIIASNRNNLTKYGRDGALIPLNDLIEEHAPNIKKYFDEHPEDLYALQASDGNIYYIPFIQDGEASEGWFIRKDWLRNLNLEEPKNIDELYKVATAFKTQDPNGNGKADEVPLFGDVVPMVLSLYNINESFSYVDGKAVYNPMTDEFKEAISVLAKWYKEGLIDQEVFMRTDARNFFLNSNTGGISHSWFGSSSQYNETLKDTFPGIDYSPMAPPAGVDGVIRELKRRGTVSGEGWGISATNKNPELAMKYLDFWWTEEGRRLANFGIEGRDYDMVDGKPIFREEVLKNPEMAVSAYTIKLRANLNFGFRQDFAYEEQWLTPIAKEGMELYEKNGYIPKIEDIPVIKYDEDVEQNQLVLKTQLETHLDECVQKWILGKEDVNTGFSAFKNQMKSLGVEDYIRNEQNAYDNYLKIVK